MELNDPFPAIAGHAAWKRYFIKAIANNALAHAYLLSGPESVGKWSFAKEVAKRIVCKQKSTGAVCGNCSGCLRFDSGSHPDVAIVDAVAQGDRGLGVEEARERVVEAFRLKPHDAPMRVVLVNDADRMEPAAQNAILKTLEEPPARSLLLLIARDASLLLETVVSRCFLLRFSTVSDAEFEAWLRSRDYKETKITKILSVAGGAPGRALDLKDDALLLNDLARACLSASEPPFEIAKKVAALASQMSEKSAFERRRKVAFGFCAAVATQLRLQTAASGADPGLSFSEKLERIVAAAGELSASATPELVTDRLILDLAPALTPRS